MVKILKASVVILLLFFVSVLMLSACGGGGGGGGGSSLPVATNSTPSPDPAPDPPTLTTPRFAYAVNRLDDTLSIYAVDASTGKLRHNGYVLTGTAPTSVAVDPSGRFVYVANNGTVVGQTGSGGSGTKQTGVPGPGGDGSLSVCTINQTTGALTLGTAVAAGTNPALIAVDPSGKFAYVANWGSNNVSVYTIDQTTGALTQVGAPVAAGTTPVGVTVEASGRFVHVTSYGADTVSVYTIDQTSGALTTGAPVAAGAEPFRITTVSVIQ